MTPGSSPGEEAFAVSLGGRRWAVPHLPFRAIKAIQPVLFDVYLEAGGPAMSGESVARLGEAQLDRLAEATWRAVSVVDPELSLAEFPRPSLLGRRIDPGLPVGRQGGRPSPGQKRGPTFACACDAGGVARRGKVDFDALIAQVVSNTGWSWDQALDQLTMPRFLALQAEWRRNPPIHWLAAAVLKYRAPSDGAPPRQPTVAELKAAFPNGAL